MTERALSVFRYTLKGGNLNMQDFEKYILGRKSSLELGESTRYLFIANLMAGLACQAQARLYRASNMRQRGLDFAGQC